MNKIALVGCGNVGMAYAYALVNQKVYVDELILIDINDVKIVVIAAGANQSPGETRMDLIHKNSKIFKSIVSNVMESGFNGIFVVATNPLDVMTYLTLKYSNLPTNKVIGSGTTLDTSRLRYLLSEKTGVNPKNIEAYVIGEHGDSEFVPWSNVNIAYKKISDQLSKEILDEVENEVKNSAYEIINKKGATAYGIGMCLVKITNAIIENKNTILPVSSWDKENKLCISTPAIVGSEGVKDKIFIPLSEDEKNKLINSINTIKNAIESIEE